MSLYVMTKHFGSFILPTFEYWVYFILNSLICTFIFGKCLLHSKTVLVFYNSPLFLTKLIITFIRYK